MAELGREHVVADPSNSATTSTTPDTTTVPREWHEKKGKAVGVGAQTETESVDVIHGTNGVATTSDQDGYSFSRVTADHSLTLSEASSTPMNPYPPVAAPDMAQPAVPNETVLPTTTTTTTAQSATGGSSASTLGAAGYNTTIKHGTSVLWAICPAHPSSILLGVVYFTGANIMKIPIASIRSDYHYQRVLELINPYNINLVIEIPCEDKSGATGRMTKTFSQVMSHVWRLLDISSSSHQRQIHIGPRGIPFAWKELQDNHTYLVRA